MDDEMWALDDEDFNAKLQAVLLNQRKATLPGMYYAMVIGDWRRGGRYSSYQAEVISSMPSDNLAAVLIKQQHNTRSDSKRYPNDRHEPLRSTTWLEVNR